MNNQERLSIQEFISTQIIKKKEHRELGEGDELIATGIIDSLGIIRLVTFLETTFGIRIQDEDLLPDNFSSVAAIASFVCKKR